MTNTYTSTVTTPSTVVGFFATLAEFGTVIGAHPISRAVTVYIHDEGTSESLGARILSLKQTLGERGFTPAFPTSVPGHWNPTYRWEFGEPTYAGEDRWAISIPATDDLLHLFDTLTGFAVAPDRYTGETPIEIRLSDYTGDEVFDVVADMREELHAWFGEPIKFSVPQRAA